MDDAVAWLGLWRGRGHGVAGIGGRQPETPGRLHLEASGKEFSYC